MTDAVSPTNVEFSEYAPLSYSIRFTLKNLPSEFIRYEVSFVMSCADTKTGSKRKIKMCFILES